MKRWGLVLLAITSCWLATSATGQTKNKDVTSEIEAVRADARADKVEIIRQAMNFTPEESSAFWPIYKNYEYDLSKLNDRRVELVKSYAEKYSTLTDADAKKLSNEQFDLDSSLIDLKKHYYKVFNEKLPATTVSKFFQLEHRLDLLVELKVASELPSLLAKPPAKTTQGAQNQ